jgi:hypothetical protein
MNEKITNLEKQIAELQVIKYVALGTMNVVTVVSSLTRQYVIDIESKITELQDLLTQERKDFRMAKHKARLK